jgi:hypothetical protein
LLVELEFKAHWAIKRCNMDFEAAETKQKMQLSTLEEKAYHSAKTTRKEPRDGTTRES